MPPNVLLGVVLLLLTGQGCTSSQPSQSPETRPPNLVVVIGDDMAQWAVGAYGNPTVETPNIDRLAQSGLLLENATSPAAVCSPARASFFSGLMPSQHGIHDFLRESREFEHDWLTGVRILPERLQDVGYRTALIGKWHVTADATVPYRGFDRWVSYDVWRSGWQNQYDHQGVVALSDGGEPFEVEGPQSEYLTRRAVEFIEAASGAEPFFLYLAPADTHEPFEGQPERHVARYRGARFHEVPRRESSPLPAARERFAAPSDLTGMLEQYYAGMSMADEQVGEIVEALSRNGQLDHTLLVVTSDQGHMNGHHGLVGKSNATLPQNLYEEVVRIPMVLHWPDGFGVEGRRLELPFDLLDLHQTLLDAAGVPLEADGAPERAGRSLLPRLRDPTAPWRRYRYTEHGTARAIADERYKLIRRYPPLLEPFGDELYDLLEDPREAENRIDDPDYREVAERLGEALDRHFERYEDPLRTGRLALEQPPTNGNEPWRRLAGRP